MYTVGQVAHFLGMSRDTLKFYEEKGLVRPKQEQGNGYRKYNELDIFDIMTTNFYREIDLEIKKIQEIKKGKTVKGIIGTLEEKEQELLKEIDYKKLLLKQIREVKENCEKVKKYLGKHTIKEMKPLEVKGELTHFNAYKEYNILQQHTTGLKKAVTLTDLRRIVYFNEIGITENRFIVVREAQESEQENPVGEVFKYSKCIYTIIEDGRWLNGERNIDDKVGNTLRKMGIDNGYELLGVVFVNMLLTTYEDELERVFLEIYSPIK